MILREVHLFATGRLCISPGRLHQDYPFKILLQNQGLNEFSPKNPNTICWTTQRCGRNVPTGAAHRSMLWTANTVIIIIRSSMLTSIYVESSGSQLFDAQSLGFPVSDKPNIQKAEMCANYIPLVLLWPVICSHLCSHSRSHCGTDVP